MSERRPSRTGPTAGRRMPTRSQPSPGGLQEMPLNPPPRKRGTKRKGTQDTLDTAMAASATASSEEPTSATEQTTIPSISRSQSPHDTDSRSQATPAAESRSISPPAVTGNGTRPESRDISPTPAPALYTRRKIRTQQVVTQPKSKSAASAGSKRSRDDNDSSTGKSADIQEATTAGEDRPAKRARHGGSPLIDPTILPNVSGEESPVQSAGPSKKKAAMTYPSKQSSAPLRPGVKPQVPRRNNPIHEAGKEAYDDGYESISEPEEPMTLGELKELKRNGFKLNFEPRTNMVAKINRATRPSMNNLESSSAANFSSAASSTAHPLSSQSKILLPAHLSKKERILTNPDLVAATHRFADWVEANPSRAIPSADEMEGLLEYFHTQQQADKSSIATIQNDEPNHKIQEGINKERPPVPQGGSSEGVSEAHESQTPATQQTTGGWNTWSGITTLFATPFKFTRDQAPTPTAVTTNAHPVTDIAVFSSLSSVPATPTPAGPRPRPGAHNNHRARQSSGHSQNRNSVRRRREEPKKLPIEQRGLLSQEEIAERHRLQDLENEKAMSKQRNERRASYVARAELEENEISLRAIDTPKLRHRRPEEGDEFTWNGLERVVSGGRLKRKRDWVKPSGTYGLPRPEEVEEKSDDEKDPMIEDLPHLMVDEFEDLSVEVSSLAHNQQNSNAGGVPRISYGPDGTVLGDPHHARPYTGTLFQQPPDVQANIDEGRFPLTPRQNIQIFNPFSPPANLNCLPPEPHNVPGSPPKSILRSPGKIDRRVSRAAAFLRRPKLDFGNIPQINPSETSNAGVVADAPQINPSKTSDANVVADVPQLDPAPVERAPPVSDTDAPPPISNTPTPQVDPTSIMLGNYRVERAPPVSDTGAPPPVSNTPTPQIDPTSIMLGNYRVERAPTAPSGVTASSSVGFASFASKPGFVAATANSSTTESKPDTNTTLNVFNTLGNDRVERASPVSDSTGRSDSANPEVNADLPDPTSFSLGDHVVSRPTTDASEPSRQSDSSTQSKPTSALQQKQWSQVPPPKPRPGNAQLPQHQAAIEQARNVADKFKPFRPSNLRNMIQLSPSEKEKENAGLTSLEIPRFSNEVLAAVMAVPDEMVYPFRKVKAVPSVEEVVRNGLDWFS